MNTVWLVERPMTATSDEVDERRRDEATPAAMRRRYVAIAGEEATPAVSETESRRRAGEEIRCNSWLVLREKGKTKTEAEAYCISLRKRVLSRRVFFWAEKRTMRCFVV